jgi:transcriptional regulator with XRE-family HTH domain
MDKPERIASHLARNLSSLRHARGLTQATLAKAAGLPRSTIANLESGGGNPSLAVLVKVAAQLRVPIDELLASPRAKVRKWGAAELPSSAHGRGVTQRPLVPEPVPEEMLVRMEFAPGAVMAGTPHLSGTREYFSCLQGAVTIFVVGDRYDLAEGDVLAFPGNVPHSYRNPGTAASMGISVVIFAKAGV